MRRSFVADRSNRRDFLRVSVASIAGIALVEFVAPKEVRAPWECTAVRSAKVVMMRSS